MQLNVPHCWKPLSWEAETDKSGQCGVGSVVWATDRDGNLLPLLMHFLTDTGDRQFLTDIGDRPEKASEQQKSFEH